MLWIQQGSNTLREHFSFKEMINMRDTLSRRRFLQATTTTAAFMAGPGWLPAEERTSDTLQSLPAQAFRIVHLTDIHVQPEQRADQGLAQCLKAVMQLDPRPDFILTGGDLVMDVFEQEEPRGGDLFTLLEQSPEGQYGSSRSPLHRQPRCLRLGCQGHKLQEHPKYGKKMIVEQLGLRIRYYRFDHKGWRFYVLDDIQPAPNHSYQAYLDEPQMAWLEEELRGNQTAGDASRGDLSHPDPHSHRVRGRCRGRVPRSNRLDVS